MGDAGFFKGTSADQDSRFSNKEKKLLKTMSFPPEFEQKVNMKKVNLDVIRPWISNRITELLGFEDEVVVDYASSLLEEEDLDPKRMQINLTGFLESKTKIFIKELWNLLLSAQNSVGGIPAEFIEQKKEELRKQQEEEEKRRAHRQSVMDTIRKKQAAEMEDLRKEEERRRPYYDDRRRKRDSRSPVRRRRYERPYSRSRSRSRYSRSRSRDRKRHSSSRHHRYRDDDYYERSRSGSRRRRRGSHQYDGYYDEHRERRRSSSSVDV